MSRFRARSYLGFLAWATLLTGGVVALGALPALELGGPGAIRALLAGCAVSLVASAVGALPLAFDGAVSSPLAVLAPMALRFVVVLGLALAALLLGHFEPVPLLLSTAASYLVLLFVDTRYALRASDRKQGTG